MGVFTAQRKFFVAGEDPIVTIRQPYLQNVRQDRATVMWATETTGEGAHVVYSPDGKTFRIAFAQSQFYPANGETGLQIPFAQHVATLNRLQPNTRYEYYPVVSGEPVSPGSRFRTAGPGPFRFLVLGDSGMGTPGQLRVAARLNLETDPSFLIHVGDIAYDHGNFSEFQKRHFDIYQELMLRLPFFTAPGNHEYDTPNAAAYMALHSPPTETVPPAERGRYYSFDWGNVHFVSLDSHEAPVTNEGSLRKAILGTGDMLNWLKRDLRSTRQFWKVVFFHHPPYAGGQNYGDFIERDAEKYLCPILESNGVQLVLNGHEHSYQRTHSVKTGLKVKDGTGTVYMTLGGGGATLYQNIFPLPQSAFWQVINHFGRVDVDGGRLTLRAISDSGVQIDSVTISPLPVLADANPVVFDPDQKAGSLLRIRGFNLAFQETFTQTASAALSGTSVRLNGKPLGLLYVSPTQLVCQLAESFTGPLKLSITTANGTEDFPL